VEVVRLLIEAGADVISYEPFKVDSQIPEIPVAPSLEAALKGSDLLVLLVAHTPIKNLTPTEVASLTEARLVVDTVNLWLPEVWEPAGFTIHRLGVGRQNGKGRMMKAE
jgi:UDP-N-acetyl-D-mannosaminuronate dehydrogenase